MNNLNLRAIAACCLCLPLIAFSQNPEPGNPPPGPVPPAPDTPIDEGTFDIFQGPERRAFENFRIVRKPADQTVVMVGKATYAIQNKTGSDIWEFFPEMQLTNRGVQRYKVLSKFPIGPGETSVEFDGGKCVWKNRTPDLDAAKPIAVPLPPTGFIVDKNLVHHWAIVGLLGLEGKSFPVLDPESGRVTEARVSKPVPARIDAIMGSLICNRVLVTLGSYGLSLWLAPDGRLLRMEAPQFGITAIRRQAYGTPGLRVELQARERAAVTEKVTFQDSRQFLTANLTRPAGAGPFPLVIFLSDSGPQDMDGNPPLAPLTWNHQRDIANYLATQGVACLRWDDAGTGESPMMVAPTISDLISQARAAIKFAKAQPSIDPARVGAIGHGEGATIALQFASTGEVAFALLLGAPGATIDKLFLEQLENDMKRAGVPQAEYDARVEETRAVQQIFMDPKITEWKAPFVPQKYLALGEQRIWFRDLMRFDPQALARAAKVPVFAIHGDADVQVPVHHLEAMRSVVGEKRCLVLRGHDHFLMPKINGDAGDMADPDRRISDEALKAIADFLK